MDGIELADLLGRERYGTERDTIRRRIVEYKRARRAAAGDRVTFVFEDRATIWYQIQEMLWVEHITDLDAVREEIAVYNQLLPGPSELSATLLVEIEDQRRVREELDRLIGIDEHVALAVGAEQIPATFEAGRQTAERISAVQYVRFALGRAARAALAAGAPVALAIDHPNYRARTDLPDAVRASLAAEVADPDASTRALRQVRDGG